MKFEKYSVYEFQFKEFKRMGEKPYFLLTYGDEKATTMERYKENGWCFRVEVNDFQMSWLTNEIWDIFPVTSQDI